MSYLICPECGSRDAVPKRVIVHSRLRRRWWLFGPIIAVPEAVGNVHLCARCACEWCATPAGVHVPRAGHQRPMQNDDEPPRKHPLNDDPRLMRDSDQPWERARR